MGAVVYFLWYWTIAGEVSFYHERINEFLNVAKDFDITEIDKNIFDEDEEEGQVEYYDNQISESGSQGNDIDSAYIKIPNEEELYKGEHCDYKTNQKGCIKIHVQSIHKGVKYPCQYCDYQATQVGNLRQHIKSKHEGEKYPCQKCDHQATTSSNLQKHIKAKHEGVKYPCQQCDYMATTSSNLQQHTKSKHDEGVKYPFQQCDYQGNYYSTLYAHVKSKH